MCNGGLNGNDTIFVYKFYHNVKLFRFTVGIGLPRTFYAHVVLPETVDVINVWSSKEKRPRTTVSCCRYQRCHETASFLAGN